MPWAAVAGAVVGGVVNAALAPSPPSQPAASGPSGVPASGSAAATADPFASQRPQYQTQLNSLMNGQFSPSDPSYNWRFNQGMEGVNRTMAAQGLNSSGQQLTALENYGQGQASTEYANQFSRLSQLAGGNIGSPAAAGQLVQGQQAQQQAGATAFGSTVGNAVGSGVNSLVSGWLAPTPTADASQSSVYQPSSSSSSGDYWNSPTTGGYDSNFWSGISGA